MSHVCNRQIILRMGTDSTETNTTVQDINITVDANNFNQIPEVQSDVEISLPKTPSVTSRKYENYRQVSSFCKVIIVNFN